ncbi:TetR/AcrR family transcriptional regulator [Nocardia sp. CDC159]|uniref:TetR/AcrR family transcriptional regulator n=1 Tax=Nocardia pulmonis TaxID=2951408 RepID=A0A9X2EAR5_9NOCA|nr:MULTISPECIES: TetR/AcrR family transcriptional regulator [Nocardia]MCM6776765.1 TetR/AcrR family transcriptional regulator [Nocardia pulmonis]MCM6789086.1 TetR/AcrR family transcriptional regulator [Nocardia sp. CDC159]
MRAQLIEAGIRLLESEGPQALQTRRVAAEVGASTMAVYTHFGGMTELISAIVAEAFARFGAALAVPPSADPIEDFLLMGYAYRAYALAAPQRYLLMFGLTRTPETASRAVDHTAGPVTDAIGAETFEQLVAVVERMMAAEVIGGDSAHEVAARLWGLIHGVVSLELAGKFGTDGRAAPRVLLPATVDLLVGMGADRARVDAAVRRATGRIRAAQAS